MTWRNATSHGEIRTHGWSSCHVFMKHDTIPSGTEFAQDRLSIGCDQEAVQEGGLLVQLADPVAKTDQHGLSLPPPLSDPGLIMAVCHASYRDSGPHGRNVDQSVHAARLKPRRCHTVTAPTPRPPTLAAAAASLHCGSPDSTAAEAQRSSGTLPPAAFPPGSALQPQVLP